AFSGSSITVPDTDGNRRHAVGRVAELTEVAGAPAVDVRCARDAADVAVAQFDRVEPEAGGHQVGRGVGNELRRRRVDALAVPELAVGATPPAEAVAGLVDPA